MQPLKCFSTGSRALSSPFLWTRIRSHAVQQYQMAAYSQLPSTRDGSASSPYTPGTTITINGHVPPPPTNPTSFLYRHMNRLEKAEVLKDRKSLSLADRCRKYPPIQTQPPDSKGLQLKIVKPLRVGVSNPSQVVVAMVESIAGGAPLIAKIFDSFYWDHEQYNIDPFRIVDYHYSHEAAAYVKLRDLQGSYVPKYYGSYTCELPLDSGTRSVRLVLLEYIQGTSLEALGPDVKAWLPQAARQNIMEKLIRAESYVYAREVDHGDLYPRNVIIQSKDVQSFHKADLRLVLFDFASASVGWDSEDPLFHAALSPILRWNYGYDRREPFEHQGWVDWKWQPWLERCFAGDPAFAPITDELRKFWIRPYSNEECDVDNGEIVWKT